MRIRAVSWLLVSIGLLLLLSGVMLGNSVVKKMADMNGRVSMNKVAVSLKDDPGQDEKKAFSREDMDKLKTVLKNSSIAYSGERNVQVEGGDRSTQGDVTGTNELYKQFAGIKMKKGSYFTGKALEDKEQVAVIEDTLAWELFKTDDVVGMNIEISGKTFRINGVAAKDESLVQDLSDTGIPRVYIPAGTMLDLKIGLITGFQVETKDSGTLGGNEDAMTEALISLGKNPDDYKITDYNIERALAEQQPRLLVFLAGLEAMLLLAVYLRNRTRGIYRIFREGMKTDYFMSVLKENRLAVGADFLKGLAVLAAWAVIWKMIRFHLYIPAEWIPDKLTDFSYFADLFKSHWQEINAGLGYVAPGFEREYNGAAMLLKGLFYTGLAGGFGLLAIGFYQLRLQNIRPDTAMLFISLAMLAGLGITSAVSVALGLPPGMDMRSVLAIFVFLSLNTAAAANSGGYPLPVKNTMKGKGVGYV